MSDRDHRAHALRFLERINVPDGNASAWGSLHEQVVLIVNGSTALSGVYAGRQQIEHVLLGMWRERVRDVRFELLEVFQSEDAVALLLRPGGMTLDGRSINPMKTPMGAVIDFRDDEIIGMRLYPDTKTIETELFGNRFITRGRSAGKPI